MEKRVLRKLEAMASEPAALEKTIGCLADSFHFLRAGESAVILFPAGGSHQIGFLLGQAVRLRGANPIFWTGDLRWRSLLRLCFSSRATTVIGPPLILLGLAKLARTQRTPLNIFHAVCAGYHCTDWMIEGIAKGLDCTTWGIFDLGSGPIVCGLSCPLQHGVHIREEIYAVDLVDDGGNCVPDGELGHIIVYPKAAPSLRLRQGEMGRLSRGKCTCGSTAPLLSGFTHSPEADGELLSLRQQLYSWMSILDCKLSRGEYGLELDMVVFPGEKLPKLPSCAKLSVRSWNPELDEPFDHISQLNGTFI